MYPLHVNYTTTLLCKTITMKIKIFTGIFFENRKNPGFTPSHSDDPVTRAWKMTQMTHWPGDPVPYLLSTDSCRRQSSGCGRRHCCDPRSSRIDADLLWMLILTVIAFSTSLVVSPFTLAVIILDFVRSTVMLTAVWTLLSAATLMSGTGYQLMSWTVTVSRYLSEDWHV